MKTHKISILLLFLGALMSVIVNAEEPVSMNVSIAHLQTEWARIKYQLAEKQSQIQEMTALAVEAGALAKQYPDKAEPKIWQGIIVSTAAGMDRGLASLGKLKKSKKLFLAAIKIDPNALQGSAYTSLASLYYQVPAWPISFGNDKKARKYFSKALTINPVGLDSNYFYADFLKDQKEYSAAKKHFLIALEARPRYGRKLADEGRKQEIRAALAQLSDNISSSDHP